MNFEISKNALKPIYAMVIAFAQSFLQKIAQNLWDAMWVEIFGAITEAEKEWDESGRGEEKKQFVIDKVFEFVQERKNLNFIERQALKILLNITIDSIIKTINEEMGKNWVEKVKEYEDELDDKIPFIQ